MDNWLDRTKPGANDVAVLSGSPTNAPEIPFDTSATVGNVILHQTATFDLTIYGTLVTKGSLIQPTQLRGFKGTGTLTLTDTPGVEYDHVWTRGFNKVKTVGVEGGKLEVASTFGQLGPDAVLMGGSSDWKVGTSDSAGAVELNGDHFVGFDWLTIVKGEVKYVTGGTLTDLPIPGSLTPWKAFAIENVDKFEIAEGQPVALTGGRYLQSSGTSTFRPGSSLGIAGFEGASNPPEYSFDMLGGKLVAFESAGITTRTDIRIADSVVEFYCPGVFTRSNGPEQTSALAITAQDGTNKEIQITNTPIKFLDWNPAGRYTSATQVGGRLNVGGNLKLDGTTELVLRVDLANVPRMDRAFDATGTVTLSGGALKLSLNLKNIPQQGNMFMFNDLIWGTALTAPNPPFVNVSVNTPGWTPTITKDANSLDLVLMRM